MTSWVTGRRCSRSLDKPHQFPMNFILLIYLSGVFSSEINNLKSNMEELPDMSYFQEDDYYKEKMDDLDDYPEKYKEDISFIQKEEMDTNNIPANEKTGNYYKDIKQYVFTTNNPNGTESEISLTATTDMIISLGNYKTVSETTGKPIMKEEKSSKKQSHRHMQKPTPNVPAFWTILSKALQESTVKMDDKDQLYRHIPGSDVNATHDDRLMEIEQMKIKLMLGISLMSLILFIPLLACFLATVYKMNQLSYKSHDSQYSINPELTNLSYFHPSEGVSDTSFSKSAESSTLWGTSELQTNQAQE